MLLHAQPLMLMRHFWSTQGDDVAYDPLCLSLKLFEVVIDQSGFGRDVTREAISRELVPLLHAMDAANSIAIDNTRHRRILDRLIGNLLNESNRGESFSIPYTDFDDDGVAVGKQLSFKLLREVHGYSGDIAIELSSVAINLFLNALDLDIESEQIASEAVVKFQMAQGHYEKARTSAEAARARSIQYEQQLHRFIDQAKRDIHRVDWQSEVHDAVVEANTHVDLRLRIEEDIIRCGREKLDLLVEDNGSSGSVAEVVRLIEDCRTRHLRLNRRLMTARDEFIQQQTRQCFLGGAAEITVNMRDDLLDVVLAMSVADSTEVMEQSGHALLGAVPPEVFNLRQLVAWQLQPRREQSAGSSQWGEVDLIEMDEEPSPFDEDVMADCEKVFHSIDHARRLSDLLSELEDDGVPLAVQDVVTLRALEQFGPDEDDDVSVGVELAETGGLRTPRCSGDDMWLEPSLASEDER